MTDGAESGIWIDQRGWIVSVLLTFSDVSRPRWASQAAAESAPRALYKDAGGPPCHACDYACALIIKENRSFDKYFGTFAVGAQSASPAIMEACRRVHSRYKDASCFAQRVKVSSICESNAAPHFCRRDNCGTAMMVGTTSWSAAIALL